MKKLKELLLKLANAIQGIFLRPDLINTHLGEEPTWTKESSFALVISHDYRRDTYPVYTTNKIRDDIMSESAATVRFIVDADATTQAFLDALREGIQYKTFFFYINGHGNNKCIRLADRNLLAREVWEVLRTAQNRIVGFFDACMSGSMIVDPNAPQEKREIEEQGVRDDETMADYLVRMFKEENAQKRGNCCEEKVGPQIKLYSACENGVVTTYEPESSTKFADAILYAYKKTEGKTYVEFDKVLVEKGTYGNSPKMDPMYRVVPQIAAYGKDFSDYERMR